MADDDLKAQLEATQRELAELKAERDWMIVAGWLAREFRRRGLPDQLADESAGVLAREVKRVDGKLIHGPRVGVTGIVADYLSSRPWLTKAASKNTRQAPEPGSDRWDIKRAVNDVAYNNEWKAKDPESHKAAWDAYLKQRVEQTLGG